MTLELQSEPAIQMMVRDIYSRLQREIVMENTLKQLQWGLV